MRTIEIDNEEMQILRHCLKFNLMMSKETLENCERNEQGISLEVLDGTLKSLRKQIKNTDELLTKIDNISKYGKAPVLNKPVKLVSEREDK